MPDEVAIDCQRLTGLAEPQQGMAKTKPRVFAVRLVVQDAPIGRCSPVRLAETQAGMPRQAAGGHMIRENLQKPVQCLCAGGKLTGLQGRPGLREQVCSQSLCRSCCRIRIWQVWRVGHDAVRLKKRKATITRNIKNVKVGVTERFTAGGSQTGTPSRQSKSCEGGRIIRTI